MNRPPSVKTNLAATGEQLGAAIGAGVLGNTDQRKNRGRLQQVGSQFVRLLDVTGDDQLARQITVSASIQSAGDLADQLPAAVLRVQWGNDGATAECEVDLCRGVCFSVSAAAVRCDVRVEDDDAPDIQVGLSAGYETALVSPRRTVRAPAVGIGASVDLPIPAFADSLQVLAQGRPFTAALLDRAGAVLETRTTTTTNDPVDIDLPNGATALRLTNGSGALNNMAGVFRLAL